MTFMTSKKEPLNDFNNNLYDQLLNCMTSYIEHWSTTSKKNYWKKIVGTNPDSWWNPHQGIQLVQRLFKLNWPSARSWKSQGHQRVVTKSAPNEQVKLKTSSKNTIFWTKFCHYLSHTLVVWRLEIHKLHHFMDCSWKSWHPLFFMVQCMTFMSSYNIINDSLWVQCFLGGQLGYLIWREWNKVSIPEKRKFKNTYFLESILIHFKYWFQQSFKM